jgi:hypothetical protein
VGRPTAGLPTPRHGRARAVAKIVDDLDVLL